MLFMLQSSVVYEISSPYLSHLTKCFFGPVIVKSHVESSCLIIVGGFFSARFSTRWCFAQATVCSNCHVCWIEGAFIWSDRYFSCLTNDTHALKVLYFIFIKGVKILKIPPPPPVMPFRGKIISYSVRIMTTVSTVDAWFEVEDATGSSNFGLMVAVPSNVSWPRINLFYLFIILCFI